MMTAGISAMTPWVICSVMSERPGPAVAVIALSAVVSGLLVRRRLDRLDLVAVLKMRE